MHMVSAPKCTRNWCLPFVLGSGIETIAHIEKAGSAVCITFCAFKGALKVAGSYLLTGAAGSPLVLRFHGRGRVVLRERDQTEYDQLKALFRIGDPASVDDYRAIVVVECERIFDSCGYGVPTMEFTGYRSVLPKKIVSTCCACTHSSCACALSCALCRRGSTAVRLTHEAKFPYSTMSSA
jgi:hypothetical protein